MRGNKVGEVASRVDWAVIKSRLQRTPALGVATRDRRSVHAALRFLGAHYPEAQPFARLLPISTMQWSSVVLGCNDTRIAFIDIEQGNALSLLMSRGFWRELPIFSYAEFMIRAAEAFYDDGDLSLAAAMSECANERLRQYCEYRESGSAIARPKSFDLILPEILESNVILSFIIGHELGHLLQAAGNAGVVDLFNLIDNMYIENNIDNTKELGRARFVMPEIVQKFDDAGNSCGYAIQGTKLARLMPAMWAQQTKEVQSDALGVVVASAAAIAANIPVEVLFNVLLPLLENTEMLMILRRLLSRLPRNEKRAAISLESTSLIARQILLIRLARGLKDGSVPAPEAIIRYWSALPEDALIHYESMIENGRLEQLGLRSSVIVRGGIELALQGNLAPLQPPEELTKMLGIAAGGLIVAQAHRGYPETFYKIEDSFDWNPSDPKTDSVLYGFGSAIRDICALSSTETRSQSSIRQADILRDGSDAAFIEFLRSARSQIFRMQLNPDWAHGFEPLLRKSGADQ